MRYYKYEFTIHGGDGAAWENYAEVRFTRYTQEWITQQYLCDAMADFKLNWPMMRDTRLYVNVKVSDISDGEANELGNISVWVRPDGDFEFIISYVQEF